MFKNVILFLLLISSVNSFAQQRSFGYDFNYFRSPMEIPLQLTANFGELRPNHWHMGLDIRTQQKENLPIYAAADGYVAKIFIHPQSYGRAIYINHPNGLTTLYAHLNDFFPALEKYVVEQQYKKESWAGVINIPSGLFNVSKGQIIANSGNSGGSMGPHLHFEIKETITDRCLNPLLFNFPVKDIIPPVIQKLAIYDRGRSVYEQTPELFNVKKTGERYTPLIPLIITGNKKISFAIGAYDRDNSSTSRQGIYSAKLFLDELPLLLFRLDSVEYSERTYINAQIDYKYYTEKGAYLQHVSILPGNLSEVYKKISSDGAIEFTDTLPHDIRIEVRDVNLNSSELFFRIQYSESLAVQQKENSGQQYFYPGMVNVFEEKDFEVYLPEDCLYDAFQAMYYRNENFQKNAVSAVHKLNDPFIPVQDSFTVRIKPNQTIPAELKDKVVIQRSYLNSSSIKKVSWKGEWMMASFGDFGEFQAFIDSTPPTINSLGNKDTLDLSKENRIVFQPTDDFGVIKNFRAELDGKWLMFTNDKSKNFVYKFDDRCSYGIHELKVSVEDLVGNITTKTLWFKRYPYTAPAPKKKVVKKKK